ncbi:MAG: hypothetical protein N3E47_05035 [Candidatus Bathyarchaeota archaeon]|nr:hypothetical protein [Candidatus Bathyarchaeota archaeon]
MPYQKVFGDLEDFAQELQISKAKQAFFKINIESTPIKKDVESRLEDGTINKEKKSGLRLSANLIITSAGVLNPKDDVSKPDLHLVFTSQIAQKDCFSEEDKQEFDKELETSWRICIDEIKKRWGGSFFEGTFSLF